MSNPKFELYKSSPDNQFRFRLKAGNGEIILHSEGYETKQSCENGIASVKDNAPYDARYERKNGPVYYRFNLKAANNRVIGSSEAYTTLSGRDNGIESVKKNAPDAPVADLT